MWELQLRWMKESSQGPMFIYFGWRREKFGKAEALSESNYEVIQTPNIHSFLDWSSNFQQWGMWGLIIALNYWSGSKSGMQNSVTKVARVLMSEGCFEGELAGRSGSSCWNKGWLSVSRELMGAVCHRDRGRKWPWRENDGQMMGIWRASLSSDIVEFQPKGRDWTKENKTNQWFKIFFTCGFKRLDIEGSIG